MSENNLNTEFELLCNKVNVTYSPLFHGNKSAIKSSYYNIYNDDSMINKLPNIYKSISKEEIKSVANKHLRKNQRLIMEYLPETKE